VKAISFFSTPESFSLHSSLELALCPFIWKIYFRNRPELRLRIVDVVNLRRLHGREVRFHPPVQAFLRDLASTTVGSESCAAGGSINAEAAGPSTASTAQVIPMPRRVRDYASRLLEQKSDWSFLESARTRWRVRRSCRQEPLRCHARSVQGDRGFS